MSLGHDFSLAIQTALRDGIEVVFFSDIVTRRPIAYFRARNKVMKMQPLFANTFRELEQKVIAFVDPDNGKYLELKELAFGQVEEEN